MHKALKKLIEAGFQVYLIGYDSGAGDDQKVEEVVETPQKKKRKRKKMHWKTVNKIRALKDQGYTSGRVAEKLGISLEEINENWPQGGTDDIMGED